MGWDTLWYSKISSGNFTVPPAGAFVQDHELRSGTERGAERSAKLPGAGAQLWQIVMVNIGIG